MDFVHQEFAGMDRGSTPPLPPLAAAAADAFGPSAQPSGGRYQTAPEWLGTRSFEVGETDRLNQAHWQLAQDADINCWLGEKLSVLRARATYETRNNGMLAGVSLTAEDDIVGEDGPILTVQSDDPAYNDALENVWRAWFRAPTFRPNVSGTAVLKLWVRNLLRCGEFLATIGTDPRAEGPVAMRLRPLHPCRLGSPHSQAGNPRCVMGVEFDDNDCPTRYWICDRSVGDDYAPYPPDLVIHEFRLDEEGQARGFPWLTASLQPAADLRDFDDQVQDASRQMADQSGMLFTIHADAPVYTLPASTTVQRRRYQMAPPGWQPWKYDAGAPPAQYPDFRAERHLDLGRPINMPGLVVRLDSKNHSYSSARMDTQSWARTCTSVQCFLSGTPESVGVLNRLLDLVAGEARFSIPALRRPPRNVTYEWTFPPRKHVDPSKEADAEAVGLETQMLDGISALGARGTTLKRHVAALERFRQAYLEANLPLPAWAGGFGASAQPSGGALASTPAGRDARAAKAANEAKLNEVKINAKA